MDFDDLFFQIMNYIKTFFSTYKLTTKLVIVPSAREVNHIFPLPQPGCPKEKKCPKDLDNILFPQQFDPILLGNP
jgi:hypothetical protein